MTDDLVMILTFVSAIGCGLIGGVFFAFSAFVMKALDHLPTAQGIAAMQSINVVVLNPLFLGSFLGTAVVCAVLSVSGLLELGDSEAILRLIGSGLYLIGTVLVTVACNVPRNDSLAAVDANSVDGAALWKQYVPAWTAWNSVRTVAAVAAAVAFTIALVVD